jgi:hypothetical protein
MMIENMGTKRLHNFSISFFSVIMDLTGTAIVFSKAEAVLGSHIRIS